MSLRIGFISWNDCLIEVRHMKTPKIMISLIVIESLLIAVAKSSPLFLVYPSGAPRPLSGAVGRFDRRLYDA